MRTKDIAEKYKIDKAKFEAVKNQIAQYAADIL